MKIRTSRIYYKTLNCTQNRLCVNKRNFFSSFPRKGYEKNGIKFEWMKWNWVKKVNSVERGWRRRTFMEKIWIVVGFWICLWGQGVNFSGKISGFREKKRVEWKRKKENGKKEKLWCEVRWDRWDVETT